MEVGKRKRSSSLTSAREAIYTTPQGHGVARTGSFLVRRASLFPSKLDKRPMAVHMFNFYRELKSVCSLKSPHECHFGCSGSTESLVDEEQLAGLEWLQSLAQEGNLEELQFHLFMREIQRLNPDLEDGCLFVDGLYQLVASRTPLGMSAEEPQLSIKSGVRDLLAKHKSGTLMLQTYWHRPDDPEDHAAYLAIASSFVQFIFSTYGSQGVSQFLRKLDHDYSVADPLTENFRFKGKDIFKLEVKWKKFVEAAVNEKFRLSTFGMLRMLFRKYLLSYWFRLMVVLLIVFADVALHMLFAISSGRLLSFGFTPSSILPIVQWIGILLGTVLVRFMLMLISTIMLATVAVNVSNKLRKKLSIRLHNVTPKLFSDHSASSILSTFMQDVNSIEMVVAFALRTVIWGVLMLITCVVFTLVMVWPLGIPLAFVFIVTQLTVHGVSVWLSDHSFAKSQATNKLCDVLKEKIDGFSINKIYRLGAFWQLEMNNIIHTQYKRKAIKSLFFTKFVQLFQGLVPNVVGSLLTFAIILLIQYERVTFENGMAIFVFFTTVVIALTAASVVFPHIQTAATAMGRINALLNDKAHDLEEEDWNRVAPESKKLLSQQEHSLSVEFKNVCFSYEATASHWNLFDITLKIRAGERVSVIGRSGSGKTTFLSLVLQMLKPTSGEMIIGGEAKHTGIKVAATFQSNHIFNMSIRENIRVGNLEATDEDVEEASKQADIHSWIMCLPRGYDTAVHAGGGSLSGGQKQRIAIARMLVANAPVLVLDEVTSALDPPTESRVFDKIMEVTAGKTVIAATHRLAQAKHFDRIIVFSHGKVKEVGTHEGLLALQGTYCQMLNNEVSPENCAKAVPIVRRRSLKLVPPQLSMVPSEQGTPATIPLQKPYLATPNFTPLHTLQETSAEMDTNTHSATVTVIHMPPGNSVTEGLGINTPKPVVSSTPLHDEDPLSASRKELRLEVPHPQLLPPPSFNPLPPPSFHPITPVIVVLPNEGENMETPVGRSYL